MPYHHFPRFTRTYANAQRYRELLFVLIKYGFEDLIHTLNIDHYLRVGWQWFSRKHRGEFETLTRAARIRLMLQELGPTFVKMGQTLSTRSDLLPKDILEELSKLQDNVEPFSGTRAKEILESELGRPVEEIFTWFDEKPMAAGSIGQVHRAQLQDGSEVAVKIRRPGIHKIVATDLDIMHDFAALVESRIDWGRLHKPSKIVEEFSKTFYRELNFDNEASNFERFDRQFEENEHVHIPSVYRDLSTEAVLTLEFIHGIKPRSAEFLRENGLDPKFIARIGAELLVDQVFEHGFFHADPHPGNILVMPDNVVCYLDFGMMGRLDRFSREHFADLLLSIIKRDEIKAVEILLKVTHGHSLVDRAGLEREIGALIDHYLFRPLKDLEVGVLLTEILELTVRHQLSIPAHYFLLMKAISQVEDLGSILDPDFDFAGYAEPLVRNILLKRYHPGRIAQGMYETGSDLLYLMKEVPGEVRELLKQAKQGKVKIEMEHHGYRPLLHTLDRVSNRISSSIVLAAMIIASSLIVLSKVPPLWNEIPIIGVAGYVISGFMGIFLLRAMWKSRSL